MVHPLPYPSFLFLLFALTPTISLLLFICGSTSRKERSKMPKTSPDTLTNPTSSISRLSLRLPSQRDLAKPPSSPDPNNLTPSPQLTPTVPAPPPIVSEYLAHPQPVELKTAQSKRESHPLVVPDNEKKLARTKTTIDSYNDGGFRYSEDDTVPKPFAPLKPLPPLEPISSDPLDRSYEAPRRRESTRAPEIRRGKRGEKYKYPTIDEEVDRNNTEFWEGSLTQSKRIKPEKKVSKKKEAKEVHKKKDVNEVHKKKETKEVSKKKEVKEVCNEMEGQEAQKKKEIKPKSVRKQPSLLPQPSSTQQSHLSTTQGF